MSRTPPARDWDAIKADLEAGTPIADTAKAFKVQARTIRAYAKAHNWPASLTRAAPPEYIVKASDIANPKPRLIGRPPKPFDPAIGAELCSRIAAGEALTRICQEKHMPATDTIYRWMRENESFLAAYTRARADQADTIADQIMDIADTEPDPNRAKVRIDARKWIASKLKPQKYGEKIDISGEISNKITAIRRIIVDGGAEIEDIEAHRALACESVSKLPEK